MDNLSSLCAGCHDRAHGKSAARFATITLVCGPPGSGKTTYVEQRMQPGDLVLDVDWLWQALSGRPYYDKPDAILPYVLAARDAIIARLERPSALSRAWVIATAPGAQEREELATRLHARVVVLAVPAAECMERIRRDERRSAQAESWQALVNGWWARYQPRPGEHVIEV